MNTRSVRRDDKGDTIEYEIIPPKIDIVVERNSRGYNWKCSVHSADTVDQAMNLLLEAEAAVQLKFGETVKAGAVTFAREDD